MLEGSRLVFGGSRLVFGGSKLLLEENSPVEELEGRKVELLGSMGVLVVLRLELLGRIPVVELVRVPGSVTPAVRRDAFSGDDVCFGALLSGE